MSEDASYRFCVLIAGRTHGTQPILHTHIMYYGHCVTASCEIQFMNSLLNSMGFYIEDLYYNFGKYAAVARGLGMQLKSTGHLQ